jgi:hypothetical protein
VIWSCPHEHVGSDEQPLGGAYAAMRCAMDQRLTFEGSVPA